MIDNKFRKDLRKVIIVLPAYNEASRISLLLEHIQHAMFEASLKYEVILYDDGSSDNTFEIASNYIEYMPLTIKQHDINKGLGQTIRDSLFYAVEQSEDDDIIITMDADDTHTPGNILKMVQMIKEGFDVVVASRYQNGSQVVGVPFNRKVLSYVGSFLFRILFPINGIKDYTCGYRAYRAVVIKNAFTKYGDDFLNQKGFQCMVDILLKLRKSAVIFGEVPFILRYDLKEGETKMNVKSTIVDTLILIVKRKFTNA